MILLMMKNAWKHLNMQKKQIVLLAIKEISLDRFLAKYNKSEETNTKPKTV